MGCELNRTEDSDNDVDVEACDKTTFAGILDKASDGKDFDKVSDTEAIEKTTEAEDELTGAEVWRAKDLAFISDTDADEVTGAQVAETDADKQFE